MGKKKSQALGDWLAQLPVDEVQNWAAEVMEELTDEHALALDVAGWKIVSTIDPTYRWPFNSKASGFECPDWCDDL